MQVYYVIISIHNTVSFYRSKDIKNIFLIYNFKVKFMFYLIF